ncbi:unnamed protein product [Spodoptera exigua]|nr:unnamed protein product [Spodoptera exigua]
MSIQVENNLNTEEHKDKFEQTTHYIPCKIDSDGPANVEKYFVPYIVDKDGELTASFRGHSLDGKKMTLPEGYRAVTVTETKRPLAEDAERKFLVTGGFKEFTYWNWDQKPTKNDRMERAFDWIDISDAIHGD